MRIGERSFNGAITNLEVAQTTLLKRAAARQQVTRNVLRCWQRCHDDNRVFLLVLGHHNRKAHGQEELLQLFAACNPLAGVSCISSRLIGERRVVESVHFVEQFARQFGPNPP